MSTLMFVQKLLIVFCAAILANSNVLTSPQNYKGISSGRDGIKTASGQIAFPDDLNIMEEDMNARHIPMHHYHHHHPHHPFHEDRDDGAEFEHDSEFHREHGIPMALPLPLPGDRNYPDNDHNEEEKTPLDGYDDGKNNQNSSITEKEGIPLSFILKFNEYAVNDLLLNIVEEDKDIPDTQQVSINDRFGEDDQNEKSAAITPKFAKCEPELQTVQIAPAKHDPNILYYPPCTKIERCGCESCCSHESLSCQPIEKEIVSFKVKKMMYMGANSKLRGLQKDIVHVEKHTKCACACRIKAEDCTTYQLYDKSQCKCVCGNKDEEKKCQKYFATKLWNNNSCTCQCRQTVECSTGAYFDTNECKCLMKVVKLRDEVVEPAVVYEEV